MQESITEALRLRPPKFDPGRVLMTPGASDAISRAGKAPSEFLLRHVAGDWGKVETGDWQLNDRALKGGDRVLSSYNTGAGDTIWVITDAVDLEVPGTRATRRDTTTFLLPEEY